MQIAADEVMETVAAAKQLSDVVKVTELPPRLTTPEMTAANIELNNEVQRRCEEKKVDFLAAAGRGRTPQVGMIRKWSYP